MITFDTETSQDNEHRLVYIDLCIFYNGESYTVFDKKDFTDQISMKSSIIDYIYNCDDNLFVAHNLEYDLNSIFYPYGLKNLEMIYNNNLIYTRLNGTRKKFIDSFNFSFCSLEKIGKQIGVEKIKVEGEFYNVEYCKQDCKIVYDYMIQFIDTIKLEFNLKIKNTLAGTSQNIFLKRFDNYHSAGKLYDAEFLKYYFGGRTECFKIGKIRQPVYCLDINSSYPTSMKNLSFPVSDYYITDKPETYRWIAECDIEVNNCYVPIIPLRTEKLLFPTGKFSAYVNSIEYEKAVENNQIKNVKFKKVYNFTDSAYIFNDFVDFFYSKREIAKQEKNEFLSSFYKLILNSCYGRFALNGGIKVLKENTGEIGYYELFEEENLIYKEIQIEEKNSVNYIIPLLVTANSRIYLFEMLKKVLSIGGDILYSDTDSCYFTLSNNVEKDIDKIQDNFLIDNGLGNYSLEVYKAMDIYNVKAYVLYDFSSNIKTVCKGIPKDKRLEFLETGETSYNKPMKLRNSLRSLDKIPANYWYDIFIKRQGEYSKRTKKIPSRMTGRKKLYYDTVPIIF